MPATFPIKLIPMVIRSWMVMAGLTLSTIGRAQITVDPLPATLCASTNVDVVYTAIGTYVVGNVFTVELSDASGSFAAPSVIGSAVDIISGTIACVIPAGTSGSGFRLRVNSSSPVLIGDDNGTNITIEAPNAGLDGIGTSCGGSANAAPFLGGTPDPGGTWSIVSGVGVWAFDDYFTGMLDGEVVGYTVTSPGGCTAMATVTFSVTVPPFAGTGGAIALCSSGASVNMFSLLGGGPQAGGTWTSPAGAIVSDLFAPGVSIPGCYTYTVAGGPPCPNASAALCITVNSAPNAGTSSVLTVCSNSAPVDLMAALGGTPDPGGVWTGPSPVIGGMYEPATMTPGIYTYTVMGGAPCIDATAVLSITEVTAPEAGSNAVLSVCASDAPFITFNMLGGAPQAGGTWTFNAMPFNGVFVPGASASGCYTYTVLGISPCANTQATLCITVAPLPNAGADASVNWCQSWGALDLFGQLGGTPDAGGTWTDLNATGQLTGASLNASALALGSYPFTYTVNGIPCTPDASTVTVNVLSCFYTPPSGNFPVE